MTTNTPIYLEVCDDLRFYPQTMPRRTHESFMREHEQTEWLYQAQARAFTDDVVVPLRPEGV